jgi:hypothetical protein
MCRCALVVPALLAVLVWGAAQLVRLRAADRFTNLELGRESDVSYGGHHHHSSVGGDDGTGWDAVDAAFFGQFSSGAAGDSESLFSASGKFGRLVDSGRSSRGAGSVTVVVAKAERLSGRPSAFSHAHASVFGAPTTMVSSQGSSSSSSGSSSSGSVSSFSGDVSRDSSTTSASVSGLASGDVSVSGSGTTTTGGSDGGGGDSPEAAVFSDGVAAATSAAGTPSSDTEPVLLTQLEERLPVSQMRVPVPSVIVPVVRVICSFEGDVHATSWAELTQSERVPVGAHNFSAWIDSGSAFWRPAGHRYPEVRDYHRQRSFVCRVMVAAQSRPLDETDDAQRVEEPRYSRFVGQFQVQVGSVLGSSSDADAEMRFAWFDVLDRGSSRGQVLIGVQFLADHALMTPAAASSSTCSSGCKTTSDTLLDVALSPSVGQSWMVEPLDPDTEVSPRCRILLARVYCSRSAAEATLATCSLRGRNRTLAKQHDLVIVPVTEACYPRPQDCLSPALEEMSCSFYANCLERFFPCDDPSDNYALQIGARYCRRFGDAMHELSARGRSWLRQTTACFQEAFVPRMLTDLNLTSAPSSWRELDAIVAAQRLRAAQCRSLKSYGLDRQAECFVLQKQSPEGNSFCTLFSPTLGDWRTIMSVPDWADIWLLFFQTRFLPELISACVG